MNQHQSLTELYREMCVKFRDQEKARRDKTRKCSHCEKLEHEHDPRCTSWACSREFHAATLSEENKVAESLALMESLARVNQWSL